LAFGVWRLAFGARAYETRRTNGTHRTYITYRTYMTYRTHGTDESEGTASAKRGLAPIRQPPFYQSLRNGFDVWKPSNMPAQDLSGLGDIKPVHFG
jgi:hypothetical protein